MVFNHVKILNRNDLVNIQVVGEQIALITPHAISNALDFTQLTFKDAFIFPGLINSHDHLDFNLFPPLGNRIYADYTEWGHEIHVRNKEIIDQVLKVPRELRTRLGIYKNLLNGITTVINHGESLETKNNLINVFQNCDSLHSTRFEKNWKWKINRPGKKWPVVIHTGEGTNRKSYNEIEELIRWNFFKRKLIGIHGVAMAEKQSESFQALVWCPVSNYFLLNKTADIKKLKKRTKILFGTDSTLTAGWNLWDHLRLARGLNQVTDKELFEMLTLSPAEVWNLNKSGKIEENYTADLVIAKRKTNGPDMDEFYALNPEDILLVIYRGNIRLFDSEIYDQLNNAGFDVNNFSKIDVNGVCKYLSGDLPGLLAQIKLHYPEADFPVCAAPPQSAKNPVNYC